jgi:hypothetical protein
VLGIFFINSMVVGTFFAYLKRFSTFGFGKVGFWINFCELWGFSVKIWMEVSGIHPGYRKEGSRQTPSRIPLYSY